MADNFKEKDPVATPQVENLEREVDVRLADAEHRVTRLERRVNALEEYDRAEKERLGG